MLAAAKAPRAVAAAAVLLAAAAYLPSLGGPFFGDDRAYVVENAALRSVPLEAPWRLLTTRTNPYEFLPVRDLSYRLDLALFGLEPLGYRVHNLLLYALCCLLVYPLVGRVGEALAGGRTRSGWIATVAVAVFALHPAHVESVAWISGRKDLLCGLFALLALWLFAVGVQRPSRFGWHLGSGCCFLLANLSKASAAPVALIAYLLALGRADRSLPLPRRLGGALAAAAPLLLVAAAAVALHLRVGGETGVVKDIPAEAGGSAGARTLLALEILGYLTRIALFPVHLRLIYDLEEPGIELVAAHVFGLAALLATVVAIWMVLARASLPAFGVACFTLSSLPFLQIVPFKTWSLVGERFLFLPILGLAIAVGGGVGKLPRRPAVLAVVAVCAALFAGSLARSRTWASSTELVRSAAERSPRHHLVASAWINDVLLPAGRWNEAAAAAGEVREERFRRVLERYVEARRTFAAGDRRRAASLLSGLSGAVDWDDPVLELQLANLASETGMTAEAATIYFSVLRERPHWAEVHYNLGLVLKRLGRPREALAHLSEAVDGGSFSHADAFNNLGLVYRDLERFVDAEHSFRRALGSEPLHWHAAYNLARLLLEAGDAGQARALLLEAQRRARAAGDDTRAIEDLLMALGPR